MKGEKKMAANPNESNGNVHQNGVKNPGKFSDDRLTPKALLYMFLLALQFGIQPVLTKTFTPSSVCRTSVILIQEMIKCLIAGFMLISSGSLKSAVRGWSFSSWLNVAFLPAGMYSIQNLFALRAYQNLDALTFNVLNQTKTLSAALCCFIVLGRKQSKVQVLSLFLLLTSALVIEKIVDLSLITSSQEEEGGNRDLSSLFSGSMNADHFTQGVAPILMASFLSGLNGAITQKSLQGNGGNKNSILFSMELSVAIVVILIISMCMNLNSDGEQILRDGFFHNWTAGTLIPIVVNALGGIVVGLVTKYAGSVRKGFALIFGILISGLVQQFILVSGDGVTMEQVLGGILAGLSLWMHATNPYVSDSSSATKSIEPRNSEIEDSKIINSTSTNTRRSRKSRKED